ncbi:PQ loop repeat-domain-containing protein [Irpex lacteus]|nr:PQ loop repeat-domain-containing protein [Irpex lacteus]
MAFLSSLSDLLGYVSIGCWLGAQFPQVIENYKRRSVDGLAWPFLVNWLLGDASNLVGCILTNQLPFQTYLAVYFCFVDFSLVGQFLYYRSNTKPKSFPSHTRTTSVASLVGRRSLERPPTHYRALSNSHTAESSAQRRSSRASRKGAGMVFLSVGALFNISPSDHPEHEDPPMEYIIGRISAWICTTLYLTSRLPQIWKNYVRKSVDGLSIALFVFAFLGNFFYVASILTSPKLGLPEPESSAFLRESIPYLLGSGGTLMFDVTIVTQSFLYRPKAHLRGRHLSRAHEEEEGLLSADATGAEDPSSPSRRRLPTGGEGAE